VPFRVLNVRHDSHRRPTNLFHRSFSTQLREYSHKNNCFIKPTVHIQSPNSPKQQSNTSEPVKTQASLLTSARVAAFLGLVCLLAGCRSYPVAIGRGPMPIPSARRQAPAAIGTFTDTRSVTNKAHIGNVLGVPFVVEEGRPIESVMQSHFEAALKQAGYNIVPAADAPSIIQGSVVQWWLTKPAWGEFECKIAVQVRVCARADGKILWEKIIQGAENDLLSRDHAARAAVDVTLANAIREFSSSAFYQAVQPN
jgi:hypothetical protein